MADPEDPFDGLDDLDAQIVALDEMAKIMVPMFRAFKRNGLSGQEAAALCAAYFTQNMPQEVQGPQHGS